MAAALRIRPLDRELLFRPGSALSPELAAAQVAAYAREQVADAAATNAEALGHSVEHVDTVNGQPGLPYEAVRPGGSIAALFALGSDVLQWIYDTLVKHAPVRSSAYRSSIAIYADGGQVATPAAAAAAEEVVFLPLVPYARKIERGESKQAPDGVFQAVAALAAARYGNQARIQYTFREPMGGTGALERWARAHAGRATGGARQRRQYRMDVRQPAIVVTFR